MRTAVASAECHVLALIAVGACAVADVSCCR
ncbi:Ms4533A family Cys-rich leader peptide [Mycobacterium sp. MYCO198283]